MAGVLTGLVPACHTPFHRDGRLNLGMVERQAALFRESGLRGVFVAGTTGECASLTLDERKRSASSGSRWPAIRCGSRCTSATTRR